MMRDGQVLGYVKDHLLKEAARVRGLEEKLIELGHASGWDAGRRAAHDAMCASALIVESLIAVGADQVKRGVKLSPVIEEAVKVARSSLIAEASEAPVEPAR
jgi:hypothetical protein